MTPQQLASAEDAINVNLARQQFPDGPRRICLHPDRTTTVSHDGFVQVFCDYCPAQAVATGGVVPEIMPFYYRTTDGTSVR